LKLLPFATTQERQETEAQVHAELLSFENQMNISSSAEIKKSIVTISEDPQDSLSTEL
ncbi:15822_t:CDS:1, partial [Racocetra fulgida]